MPGRFDRRVELSPLSRVLEELMMSHNQRYQAAELEYGGDAFHREERIVPSRTRRAPAGRRRNKSPQSFNGMHRRRKRKMSW
jgi:hypothetical protein